MSYEIYALNSICLENVGRNGIEKWMKNKIDKMNSIVVVFTQIVCSPNEGQITQMQ